MLMDQQPQVPAAVVGNPGCLGEAFLAQDPQDLGGAVVVGDVVDGPAAQCAAVSAADLTREEPGQQILTLLPADHVLVVPARTGALLDHGPGGVQDVELTLVDFPRCRPSRAC